MAPVSRGRVIVGLILMMAVLMSATGVVYAKYTSRKNFVELQNLRANRDQVQVEWGRLQLELGTLATHGRVARIARKKLKMKIPSSAEVMVIRP
ncbi:MAG: cell division protein FtsL [Gammaproteobacteria bacterium]|nr:cell division protein FtsL [Gammaproteobacteria bacterium]